MFFGKKNHSKYLFNISNNFSNRLFNDNSLNLSLHGILHLLFLLFLVSLGLLVLLPLLLLLFVLVVVLMFLSESWSCCSCCCSCSGSCCGGGSCSSRDRISYGIVHETCDESPDSIINDGFFMELSGFNFRTCFLCHNNYH